MGDRLAHLSIFTFKGFSMFYAPKFWEREDSEEESLKLSSDDLFPNVYKQPPNG